MCYDDENEMYRWRHIITSYGIGIHVCQHLSCYCDNITLPWDIISNDTDLTISFVRFEPRTQHPVSDVVSPRSYRYWAVVSSGTGNSICYDHMYMYCNVDETCSLTMCSISKTEDRFLVVFVKKNFIVESRLYDIKGVFWFFEAVYL